MRCYAEPLSAGRILGLLTDLYGAHLGRNIANSTELGRYDCEPTWDAFFFNPALRQSNHWARLLSVLAIAPLSSESSSSTSASASIISATPSQSMLFLTFRLCCLFPVDSPSPFSAAVLPLFWLYLLFALDSPHLLCLVNRWLCLGSGQDGTREPAVSGRAPWSRIASLVDNQLRSLFFSKTFKFSSPDFPVLSP